MPRRAHNTTLPATIRLGKQRFTSLSHLFSSVEPKPVVSFATFTSRVRSLQQQGDLSTKALLTALHLTTEEYRKQFSVRKTLILVAGRRLILSELYEASQSQLPYRQVWQRVRSLKSTSLLDRHSLNDALTMSTPDWITFYGGGRHRTFKYDGEMYPEHHGEVFRSITAFLRSIGRYEDRTIVWSRLKSSWNLDDALSIPVVLPTRRKGLIYCLVRISTKQVYVGLTVGTLAQRWTFHVRAAQAGAQTKLARAILEDGPEGFSKSVLESGISDLAVLSERERIWAQQLGALTSKGLNTAKPGGLGGPRGKVVQALGESFKSLAEASQIVGERLGLPSYVVSRRLSKGLPISAKARRHSNHEDAGSNLYRRWLALLRRHPTRIASRWLKDYNAFKMDVQPFDPSLRLIRIDETKAWGPKNFLWVSSQTSVERKHGSKVQVFGRNFPSLKAVATHYGIGTSTLKDRIRRQGMPLEQAVTAALSATSYKSASQPVVDGKVFRSKRQAILYLAASRGWTEDQAKYRFTVGRHATHSIEGDA